MRLRHIDVILVRWCYHYYCTLVVIVIMIYVNHKEMEIMKNGNILTNVYMKQFQIKNKVQLKNSSKVDLFYFATYVSTSYDKKVSTDFAQNNGMLMQFDKNVVLFKQFKFCSLEWVSKFPYECEILIARTKGDDHRRAATINVMDYEMNSLNDKDNNNNKNNNNINTT